VIFIQTSSQILHIEFQTLTLSKPGIPFRMLDYSVRLKRQYKCPVAQVVIFLQETAVLLNTYETISRHSKERDVCLAAIGPDRRSDEH
jgi:hypothetical protein